MSGLRFAVWGVVLSMVGLLLNAPDAVARQVFEIDASAPDLIGELSLTTTVYEDTLSDLARAYHQGYTEMRIANPTVDPWLPGEGTEVVVPNMYVMPDVKREGVVVNVPEMRMYFFPPRRRGEPRRVMTFPISIGRQNWVTPKGRTKIISKVQNPAWYPPESIREEHAAEGDPLPRVVPAGPDNPLGDHALRLDLPGYLIHGTNKPYGIGMRVTHGCIRMYPKDVATMYEQVKVGTRVQIVNQPFKVGVAHGRVYLEVHPLLEEDVQAFSDVYSHIVELILARVSAYDVQLVWADIKQSIEDASGIPRVVGTYREKTDPPMAAR